MLKRIIFLCLSLLYVVEATATQIVASVDDEIITSQDVQDRTDLMKKMFNTPDEKLSKEKVLDTLVDEKVQIITAQKAGISVSADDIKEHIAFMESQNRMPAGTLAQMVQERGVSEDSWMSQVLSSLFWMRYMQQQKLKRPEISQKEIDKQLDKFRKEFKQAGYLLAEIYIPFGDDKEEAKELANSLFGRIVAGESFTDLASKYSKGKTAGQMGDLGWVKAGQMEKAIDEVLPQMEPGQMSRPIECKKGYTIILMRDYQPALDSDEQEAVQVSQLVIYEQDYEKIKPALEAASKSCMTFTQFAATNGLEDSHSGALPEMIYSRIPADLKRVLEGKEIGELIGPVSMGPYALFAMKCGSRKVSVLPSREDIARELEMDKMEKMAENILKDARKKLLVEIKK